MSEKKTLNVSMKTARRSKIIDQLVEALGSKDLLNTLDYRNKSEGNIKTYMHRLILERLVRIHKEITPSQKDETYLRKASDSLIWEGDVKTTVNHIRFLGVQHRPDFKVLIDNLRIAVEVKRGDSGTSIREGIGQSVVYATSADFDFVVYLFIDTSKDKKIRDSIQDEREAAFINSLWEHYNIKFAIV